MGVKVFRSLLLVAAGMIITSMSAWAEIEFKYDTGPCKGGGTWYCVTQYNNGRPTKAWGRGCDGKPYQIDICNPYDILPLDPISGDPTHTGNCNGGSSVWVSQIVYNEEAVPVEIRGQDCEGQFYRCTNLHDGNLQ